MREAHLLALVPARGASKGLPRKNARSLGDRPLLGWTAEAVRTSGIQPDALILSTDDDELANIGRSVGLEVPFMRPPELANDTATALGVVEHALQWFARERQMRFHAIAWLQPTSPFRPPSALAEAMRLLADAPAVIGVKDLHRSPTLLYHADHERRLTPLSDAPQQQRRQDVPALLTPNGALYVTKTETIERSRSLYPPGSIGIVMDQIASLDIDDERDWALACAIVAAGLYDPRA